MRLFCVALDPDSLHGDRGAGAPGMAETTVEAHVGRALATLGLVNRVQAAMLVHDAGLA